MPPLLHSTEYENQLLGNKENFSRKESDDISLLESKLFCKQHLQAVFKIFI